MSRLAALASTVPFAHLLGIGAAKVKEADDEPERMEGESDEDYEARKAEEKKPDEDAEDKKPEEGDDNEDEDAEDEEETKKAKNKAAADETVAKASAAGHGKALAIAGRRAALAERDRCRQIFSSKHAAGRPHVAASIAFDTQLPTKEALAVLATTAAVMPAARAGKAPGLREAMAAAATPRIAGGGVEAPAPGTPAALAAAIVASAPGAHRKA